MQSGDILSKDLTGTSVEFIHNSICLILARWEV